ncbi:MAG TPA: hypothetical protein VHM28_01200 [Anaerolineales bacterium]|nr:hypothetical protein [Anaerolineales bacterium]
MLENNKSAFNLLRITFSFGAAIILCFADLEFYQIAWGTGNWQGEFSLRWWMLYTGFSAFCLFAFIFAMSVTWVPSRFFRLSHFIARLRARIGRLRWLVVLLLITGSIWLLEYTPWGLVFHGIYIRVLIWAVEIGAVSILLNPDQESLFSWKWFLVALLLSGASFALVVPFHEVTSYPFSLGWSEGNRLYDYSIMFGRSRYLYPPDLPLSPLLDVGRQLIGGLPFLFPNLSISAERFWIAFIYVAPYLILGWLTFWKVRKGAAWLWILAGLWTYLFLRQGPIHPPLAISAILVALAWEQSFLFAVPLVFGAGYLAVISRFTWVFAASMWIGMLELGGSSPQNGKLTRRAWVRASALGMTGLFGSIVFPKLIGLLHGNNAGITISGVSNAITHQPLLWYRLLPNATYGTGIIVGVFVAVLPLILLLVKMVRGGGWMVNNWQKLVILLPLIAFLGVGLIASTKIGGGGDLHNLDMFFIGLVFTLAIALKNGNIRLIMEDGSSTWTHLLLLSLFILPAYQPLQELRPLDVSQNFDWVSTLSDTVSLHAVSSLPPAEETQHALSAVQNAVATAEPKGEILFMDQRQLLTFKYIRVPLIPDYDKKVLIDRAMSSDRVYFDRFYQDLAAHRFSLIISSPLRAVIQDSDYEFGEENNAWSKWVAGPILCFYKPATSLKSVQIDLLIPRTDPADCASLLP